MVGVGFEFRASHLQSRSSTALATPLAHFALVILEMGFHQRFAHWPQAVILPISASQVAGIKAVSHQPPATFLS
jgi:hypothetical protein